MATYVFGHSDVELRRLITQATTLRPITERLLRNAGLQPGMRVLDVGCGAGDVSMLAAELVGQGGTVVGIDRGAAAVELAAARSARAGLRNVVFREVALEDFSDFEPFDFIIGRYVVLHQPEPATFIRAAAARLRRGGTIAFHEIDMRKEFETLPAVQLIDDAGAEVMRTIRLGVPSPDAAGRLVALFGAAGLPIPRVFCERLVGAGADTPIYGWMAATLASIRVLTRPQKVSIDSADLEAEFRAAATAAHSQILSPEQCCAWSAV
jgi:SAM-dependent methyltransferase